MMIKKGSTKICKFHDPRGKEGSTKILTFMTPRVGVLVLRCGYISHIVKLHYFFKNLLFCTKA